MTDIGTGSYTIFTQIAADLLGLPLEHVEVKLGDTDLPPAAGSGGSVGAASSGSSIYLACQSIRKTLAKKLGVDVDNLTLHQGVASGNGISSPLSGLISETLVATGQIDAGKTSKQFTQASYGAHFAEVAVHAVTGEIRVRRMLGVFSAGRILNEKTARSQCYGGMIFGLGAALMEELLHDPQTGQLLNHDLAEYHIPVNADIPPIEVEFLPERDPYANPLHAKGIGELGISGAGAAIANAVYNATGIRIYEYPITLDKLLDHLPAVAS
jgi:xanthine dehydrogenase YagR molybdenum-binding subunit